MYAGRGIYVCGNVSFTTTRSARSKNPYKTPGKTKLESEIVGEVKLVALFHGKRWFPLAFSRCEVQGKLKILLGFGFIVSLLFYFVRTH